MNHTSNFCSNLRIIKKESKLSLTKFSERLQIPRTTMQSVLNDGQTTLDTACRISNALQLPLSTLTSGLLNQEQADVMKASFIFLNWFDRLSGAEQEKVRLGFTIIMEVLQNDRA